MKLLRKNYKNETLQISTQVARAINRELNYGDAF
jgi:hypothetical protein